MPRITSFIAFFDILFIKVNGEGCSSTKSVDFFFILDRSTSIPINDFDKQLEFVVDFVNNFEIDNRVSLITFSNDIHEVIGLGDYASKTTLVEDIRNVKGVHGNSNIGDAIELMHIRDDSSRTSSDATIAIVITNGEAQRTAKAAEEAMIARQKGIVIYVISVGENTQQTSLGDIASHPVITVTTYDALGSIYEDLETRLCQVIDPPPQLECTSFKSVDLFLVLDSSTSISRSDFEIQLEFVSDFVSNFNSITTNVSLTTFSTTVRAVIKLGEYPDKTALLAAITNVEYVHGNTNTGGAIQLVRQQASSSRASGHFDNAQIAIVITDGASQLKRVTAEQARLAHEEGMVIYVIAVGQNVDQEELENIASDPDSKHILTVTGYNALDSINSYLEEQVCKAIDEVPSRRGRSARPASFARSQLFH